MGVVTKPAGKDVQVFPGYKLFRAHNEFIKFTVIETPEFIVCLAVLVWMRLLLNLLAGLLENTGGWRCHLS